MPLLERVSGATATASASARQLVPDALMVIGAAAISYGTWLMYPPAGFIVAGGFSLAVGVLAARTRGEVA